MRTTGIASSAHARLAHHDLSLPADLDGDLVWIALLKLRQKELDRQRARVALFGELAKDPDERRDAVARNDARRLIEQFPRHVRHVLEVHVADLAGLQSLEVLELTL